jgi:regulator of cell morphogenesis and NO signaling
VTLVTGNNSPEIHNVIAAEVIMNFSSETKVKDIALSHTAARQVLEDAGLDYCCGGGKSLHEACLHADVSPEEVLSRLHENAKDTGPKDLNWMAAPLRELTRHIREKHHRYVREAIPHTQALSDKVTAKHGKNHTELEDIGKPLSPQLQDLNCGFSFRFLYASTKIPFWLDSRDSIHAHL